MSSAPSSRKDASDDAGAPFTRERFEAEYEAVLPKLYAWVSVKVRCNPHLGSDAEDIVQEVWARALQQLATYDTERPFGPWVFGIARLVFLETLRASREVAAEHGASSWLGGHADSVTTICRRLARDEATRKLLELVESLEDEERDLVTYCGLEGRTCAEVGVMVGSTEAAVMKRWQRLRARLRENGVARELIDGL